MQHQTNTTTYRNNLNNRIEKTATMATAPLTETSNDVTQDTNFAKSLMTLRRSMKTGPSAIETEKSNSNAIENDVLNEIHEKSELNRFSVLKRKTVNEDAPAKRAFINNESDFDSNKDASAPPAQNYDFKSILQRFRRSMETTTSPATILHENTKTCEPTPVVSSFKSNEETLKTSTLVSKSNESKINDVRETVSTILKSSYREQSNLIPTHIETSHIATNPTDVYETAPTTQKSLYSKKDSTSSLKTQNLSNLISINVLETSDIAPKPVKKIKTKDSKSKFKETKTSLIKSAEEVSLNSKSKDDETTSEKSMLAPKRHDITKEIFVDNLQILENNFENISSKCSKSKSTEVATLVLKSKDESKAPEKPLPAPKWQDVTKEILGDKFESANITKIEPLVATDKDSIEAVSNNLQMDESLDEEPLAKRQKISIKLPKMKVIPIAHLQEDSDLGESNENNEMNTLKLNLNNIPKATNEKSTGKTEIPAKTMPRIRVISLEKLMPKKEDVVEEKKLGETSNPKPNKVENEFWDSRSRRTNNRRPSFEFLRTCRDKNTKYDQNNETKSNNNEENESAHGSNKKSEDNTTSQEKRPSELDNTNTMKLSDSKSNSSVETRSTIKNAKLSESHSRKFSSESSLRQSSSDKPRQSQSKSSSNVDKSSKVMQSSSASVPSENQTCTNKSSNQKQTSSTSSFKSSVDKSSKDIQSPSTSISAEKQRSASKPSNPKLSSSSSNPSKSSGHNNTKDLNSSVEKQTSTNKPSSQKQPLPANSLKSKGDDVSSLRHSSSSNALKPNCDKSTRESKSSTISKPVQKQASTAKSYSQSHSLSSNPFNSNDDKPSRPRHLSPLKTPVKQATITEKNINHKNRSSQHRSNPFALTLPNLETTPPIKPQQNFEPPIVDDETHKRMVERFLRANDKSEQKSQKSSHSRSSRTPPRSSRTPPRFSHTKPHTTYSPPNSKQTISDSLIKESIRPGMWSTYCRRVDRKLHELETSYEMYKTKPEKHPSYKEEWQEFWAKRKTELMSEGKDYRTYDYKAEWVPYFKNRIKIFYEEAAEALKIALRKELSLPFSNTYVRNKKYHIKSVDCVINKKSPIVATHIPAVSALLSPHKKTNARSADSKELQTPTFVDVLNMLMKHEIDLGRLKEKVVDLLKKALQAEILGPIQEIALINDENCTLLEAIAEKFKGIILLDNSKERILREAISKVQLFLEVAFKLKEKTKELVLKHATESTEVVTDAAITNFPAQQQQYPKEAYTSNVYNQTVGWQQQQAISHPQQLYALQQQHMTGAYGWNQNQTWGVGQWPTNNSTHTANQAMEPEAPFGQNYF